MLLPKKMTKVKECYCKDKSKRGSTAIGKLCIHQKSMYAINENILRPPVSYRF